MKTTSLLSLLTLSSAASLANAISVQINATTSGIDKPNGGFRLITNNLYTLNTYGSDFAVTKLQLVQAGSSVPVGSVECRAYRDSQGKLPGSATFSGSQTALIGTNTKAVGGILCYVTQAVS